MDNCQVPVLQPAVFWYSSWSPYILTIAYRPQHHNPAEARTDRRRNEALGGDRKATPGTPSFNVRHRIRIWMVTQNKKRHNKSIGQNAASNMLTPKGMGIYLKHPCKKNSQVGRKGSNLQFLLHARGQLQLPPTAEGKKEKRWWPCDIRRNFSDRWTSTKSGGLNGLNGVLSRWLFCAEIYHALWWLASGGLLSDSPKYSPKTQIAWERWLGDGFQIWIW